MPSGTADASRVPRSRWREKSRCCGSHTPQVLATLSLCVCVGVCIGVCVGAAVDGFQRAGRWVWPRWGLLALYSERPGSVSCVPVAVGNALHTHTHTLTHTQTHTHYKCTNTLTQAFCSDKDIETTPSDKLVYHTHNNTI